MFTREPTGKYRSALPSGGMHARLRKIHSRPKRYGVGQRNNTLFSELRSATFRDTGGDKSYAPPTDSLPLEE